METFQTIIKKIPEALKNLNGANVTVVQNYIQNVVMSVLKDNELIERLKKGERDKVLVEISKL